MTETIHFFQMCAVGKLCTFLLDTFAILLSSCDCASLCVFVLSAHFAGNPEQSSLSSVAYYCFAKESLPLLDLYAAFSAFCC